jgi:hypothetical protein
MDNIFDILRQMEAAVVSTKRYVYYDLKSGQVMHMRNYIDDSDTFPYLEIEADTIAHEKFAISDYVVIEKKGEFTLLKVDRSFFEIIVNNEIYKLPKYTLAANVENCELLIVQDNNLNQFQISASSDLYSKFSSKIKVIPLYVTYEDDPNILYSTILIPISKLINQEKICVDFGNYDGSPCSIYVQKIFEDYKHLELK